MGGMGTRKIKRRYRTVPMSPEMLAQFEEQKRMFREKFGRDAGPNDPLFFDPDADEPKPLDLDRVESAAANAMAQAGIDPAKIYAFRRTGLLATTENWERLSPADRQAWEAAVEEYAILSQQKPN
jgi:integrase